jgi:hypothetical protein
MVGGGEGPLFGAVHRICSLIDDEYELVAGALSSRSEKARRSGEALGLVADRIYDNYASMAKAECRVALNREIRASSAIPLHLIVRRILTSVSRLQQL